MRQATLLALLVVAACSSTPAAVPARPAPPSPATPTPRLLSGEVGIAYSTDAGGACIAVAETGLAPGTKITIVVRGHDRHVIAKATVAGPCGVETLAGEGYGYAISGAPPAPFVGVAILGRPDVRILGERIDVDIDGDGTEETFRSCTSSEGVHLTIWNGRQRRWHGYHYLGYDTEPTCSEAETAD
jgi:hypothetical protein